MSIHDRHEAEGGSVVIPIVLLALAAGKYATGLPSDPFYEPDKAFAEEPYEYISPTRTEGEPAPERLQPSGIHCPGFTILVESAKDDAIAQRVCDAAEAMRPLFGVNTPEIHIEDPEVGQSVGMDVLDRYFPEQDVVAYANTEFRESYEDGGRLIQHELTHVAYDRIDNAAESQIQPSGVRRLAQRAQHYLETAWQRLVGVQSADQAENLRIVYDDKFRGTPWGVMSESTYNYTRDTSGHPWDNSNEMFASTVAILSIDPLGFYERASELSDEHVAMVMEAVRSARQAIMVHGNRTLADELAPLPRGVQL